ncbi:hypothetical protein CH063_00560 [Colletotrichum higginsianum]|uniref:Uncharacterized protein n=3 Tax=Colletotrichum destructivum species complex TaxID=2707350 RepID=H1VZ29_COLHI|nr:uncharacterized protein CH63R_10537 [Colletotrichum higginsianum IMI 349063]OBR06417.1 hypothetical protein CH63R_10537 [Colletotrichum higginsianum IMI 349063]TIC97777.1 hypothetical protein CH35J_007350 [Colletotrichum higginsianum]WQF82130.1 hypothetical protein CDEST_07144 [Colletotrichum destructivum]CCF45491.1 hypothetical protein CH063_00560 [Colletotrichum higginsianum]
MSLTLPFPTTRFGPGFTVPTAVTVTEGGRTITLTPSPTVGTPATSDASPFPDNILQQSGLAPGQIIGITVGATSSLVFLVVALVWFWNRRRARRLAARDEALDTVMEDPEKPDDAAILAHNAGETTELPAPRGLHEMPETREGPPVELPAPVERHEMPA